MEGRQASREGEVNGKRKGGIMENDDGDEREGNARTASKQGGTDKWSRRENGER